MLVSTTNRSMKTSPDADPASSQHRNDQQSQQSQCASQIAAHLKNPCTHLHLSLNLVKSLFQDLTRLGPISRFGPHQF